MNPERAQWQQVKKLLEAALEREPSQRGAFLAEACAGDAALKNEIESLIASYEEETDFLESPALGRAARGLINDPPQSMTGKLIGAYKVIREISHGGMGTVYLAARADDQYRKRAAIKLIKRGMDTEDILSRFRHERQILASLDHPNIARLLEGGTTADGLPYFVMEYIEGQTIDGYCDSKKLSTVERLKLFRTVCAAVHYAHQNLVVHRDLKPSNILVTADGTPKLLDFGIAKLLNPELYAQTIAPTAIALRPMTPDYASPEQVRGQPITTASDIYSLGVLLYELLTGHRPYRIKSSAPQEIERVICEQEPEKPSTAVNRREDVATSDGTHRTITPESVSHTREGEPDKLRRRLSGDLDNIVLMAMRKEPQRRYASVGQLSEDIRKHLEGLPVIARKDTFGYRSGKFVRRHTVGVSVAALLFVLVITFSIMTIRQSRRLAHERDKAERVSAFLIDIFKVSDPSEAKGNSVTAREILDRGAARIETELKGQPEVQATLLDTVGVVYRSLGLFDKAIPLLQKSLDIRRETLGNENLEVAQSLYDLGWALVEKQKSAEAEPLLRESLAIRRKLLGNEHPVVAESMNLVANALRDKGDTAAAETLHRETLALRRKLFGNVHHDVAQSLNNLALLLTEKGAYDEAETLYQETLAIDHQLGLDQEPDGLTHKSNYALLKDNKGEYDAAEQLYRENIETRRKVLGNEHPGLAYGLNNLAEVLRKKGDYAAAEPLFREGITILVKQMGEDNTNVATLTQNLAKVLYEKGDYATAEPLYLQSLASYRKRLGEENARTARTLSNLGLLLFEKGDAATAEQHLRQSLQTMRRLYPQGHTDVAMTLVGLGRLLTETGRASEAESLLREALEIYHRKLPSGNFQISQAESALGKCLVSLKRFEEAEPLLVGSYQNLESKTGLQHRRTQRALSNLVSLYRAWNKPDKVTQYSQRLIAN